MLYTKRKNIFISYLLVLSLVAFISGCSSENVFKNDDAGVNLSDVSSWVNLMPGNKASFHITGNVLIFNNNIKSEVENVIAVQVMQDDKRIYTFEHKELELIKSVENGNTIIFVSCSAALEKLTGLNLDKSITVKFILLINKLKIEKIISSIKIIKAY